MRVNFKTGLSKQDCYIRLYRHFWEEVVLRKDKYIPNEEQLKCLWQAAAWVTDPTAHFGLILLGVTGNGKTTLVKAMRDFFNTLHLPDPVCKEGASPFAGIWLLTSRDLYRMFASNRGRYERCKETYILAIDDLGTEETDFSEYGNRYKPIEELLSYRYDSMLPTIVTTNLPIKDVRGKYGDRLADRFNEMMEVAHMPDINFRNGK